MNFKETTYWPLAVLVLYWANPATAQVPTWSEHVAPIVYEHCTGCHRSGEVAPFPLTNYDEAAAWGSMLQYVTEIKYMPPWKADNDFGVKYLQENYLTDAQVTTIRDWVEGGMPQGDPALEPAVPVFPTGSQVGTPDLVLSFAQAHHHPGNGIDEYRYFVLPTGLAEAKNLVALEMRPGNNAIVHHALVWADSTGTAAALDAQTPEYGYLGGQSGSGSGVANFETQLPGYVPGARPHVFTNGIAQRVPANSDLVVQVHYAPTTTEEVDSSTFNLFFTDQPVNRYVQTRIMLPVGNTIQNGPFVIPADQTREFHGIQNVPFDVSMLGIAPHMHLLGTHWKVFAITPTGDTINLIRISDWDFNWQGGFFFQNLIKLPKNSKIHAFAGYDNTTNNPQNPNDPPQFVTWGEGTADEMYYLPLLYVPYLPGDEDLVLEDVLNSTDGPVFQFSKTKLYPVAPNPAGNGEVKIGFTLEQPMPVSLRVYDLSGKLVHTLFQQKMVINGEHVNSLDTALLQNGMYCAVLEAGGRLYTQKFMVLR